MSRMNESAVTAMTVPSRLCEPASGLRAWLLSYSEKISWNDSSVSAAGSPDGIDSGGSGDFVASKLSGSDMVDWARRYRICGVNNHKHTIPPVQTDKTKESMEEMNDEFRGIVEDHPVGDAEPKENPG